MKKILVINAGSSSIKFKVYELETMNPIAEGMCERLYVDGAFTMKFDGTKFSDKPDFANHTKATQYLLETLKSKGVIKSFDEVSCIGHRVVQGGEVFKESTAITHDDIAKIKEVGKLAPLHNPGAAAAMEAFMEAVPHASNTAVFDTSFHQTMPKVNYLYSVPLSWYKEHDVRRYGMHGTSYRYVTEKMQEVLGKDKVNLIVCHLGNGASVAAIKDSKSINTSMGLTPLAGITMGTRSGDIDPAIVGYMCGQTGKTVEEITNALNKESGMQALAGSSDMRDVEDKIAAGDEQAILAMNIWAKRVAEYIVKYHNDLEGKTDAIIFTAGIGENGADARKDILSFVHTIDSKIDNVKNKVRGGCSVITTDSSSVPSYCLSTDEELLIAEDAKRLMK